MKTIFEHTPLENAIIFGTCLAVGLIVGPPIIQSGILNGHSSTHLTDAQYCAAKMSDVKDCELVIQVGREYKQQTGRDLLP
jgi:hypothetical protein